MARQLRKEQGLSNKEIAKQLNVSRSSVSLWVRDIQLTVAQTAKLNQNNPTINTTLYRDKIAKTKSENAKQKRFSYQLDGRQQATIAIKTNNNLHYAGCMLYWAEGAKDKNTCAFSNSDVNMVRLFLTFLYQCYCVKPTKIRIYINCYTDNGLTVDDIQKYWSKELNIPMDQFGKTTVDLLPKSSKRVAKNKLFNGTVRIVVHSTQLVQNILGAIQEYGDMSNEQFSSLAPHAGYDPALKP